MSHIKVLNTPRKGNFKLVATRKLKNLKQQQSRILKHTDEWWAMQTLIQRQQALIATLETVT